MKVYRARAIQVAAAPNTAVVQLEFSALWANTNIVEELRIRLDAAQAQELAATLTRLGQLAEPLDGRA